MNPGDEKVRADRRRRGARQTGRKASATTLGLILATALVAMTAVWQGLQFTQIKLAHDSARREEARLRSDIDALRIRLQGGASVAQLEPVARERLGLVDPPSESLHLLSFREAAPAPGLLDQVVPNALAGPSAK